MSIDESNEQLVSETFKEISENFSAMSTDRKFIQSILSAVDCIIDAYKSGGCLYAIGNGGSAADAQHFVAELVSKLNKDRTPIKAFALTVDTSILTAIGNDYGYEKVFRRQVEAALTDKDVLLSFTTSGESLNVYEGMKAARQIGAKNILIGGKGGGRCLEWADQSIIAKQGSNTGRIQEVHLATYHILAYLLERALVKCGLCVYT